MAFLTYLLIYIATFLITELLRPKPKIEDAKPAGLGDFQLPTATEGRYVPIIWGRVNLKGPNVIWYGALEAIPLKEKVRTGLFSKKTVITGYNYFLGIQCALCRGPVSLLYSVRNDDSYCWGPQSPTGDTPVVPNDSGAAFVINMPQFFGGQDSGGGGGLVGLGRVYPGTESQAANGYLSQFLNPLPGYRGTCHVVHERLNVGFGPQLRAFEYEVERYPDGLNLASVQPGDERVGNTANPMNVVFEILNNAEWGLNVGIGNIDVIALRAVAATLKAEGNGFAWVWDRPQDVLEVVRLIEQQVDGVLFQDPVTGAFSYKLVRFDYSPGTLPLLDETNTKQLTRFARPSWAETQNQISAQYTDPRKNYAVSYAIAQDMGNVDINQSINFSQVQFPGVKSATLANQLAWRELRQLSFPAATGQAIVNRSQYDIVPGDVRELSWATLGLDRLIIRITKVDRGKILDNKIKIDFTQDIFSFGLGSYADPPDTNWEPPDDSAKSPIVQLLYEVPYRITDELGNNTTDLQVGIILVRDGSLNVGYNTFATVADLPGPAATPTTLDTIPPAGSSGMAPSGLLTAELDAGNTNGFRDSVGFIIDNPIDIAILEDATDAELELGKNTLLIDNEIILFKTRIDNLDGTFTITDLIRGALDTVPAVHADNSRVFFFSYGLGLLNFDPNPDGTVQYKARNQMFTPFDVQDFGDTSTISVDTDNRADKVYPPRNVRINTSGPDDPYFPTELVGAWNILWYGSDKFTQDYDLPWDLTATPEEAGGTFRLRIIEDPGGANTVVVDQAGLTVDGGGNGNILEQGFADDTITDQYLAEFTGENTAGTSQIWTIGPVSLYGYGYKYGEKYGGDNNGAAL